MTWPNPGSRFRLTGGRSGHVEFLEGGRTGRFEWEMLIGELDIGVWGDRFFWVDSGESMTREEVHRFVEEFAAESGARVLLTWPHGESVVQS